MRRHAAQPTSAAARGRRVLKSVRAFALIPVGVVMGLALLEIGLQIGALALWAIGGPTPESWLGGRRRVLCVGDSNTYGLYLADRAEAYPQQFERLWNAVPERTPIEVMNLGYPGTNSSKLVEDLPRMLETLRPDTVMVMVGANDYWTAPVTVHHKDTGSSAAQLLRRYSRVYRLTHMLRRAFDHRQLQVDYPVHSHGGARGRARFGDVEFSLGWMPGIRRPGGDAESYRQLKSNLRQLVDIIRSYGAEPVFLTYGSALWNYGDASRAMRITAADNGVRVIDTASAVRDSCAAEPCPEWLYEDHHPTAAGHHMMAEKIVRTLDGKW